MSYVRRATRTAVALLAGLALLVGFAFVATPAQAAPVQRHLGWDATSFPHFRVTVGHVVHSPAHGTIVYSVVCVRSLPPGSTGGKTRISWAPWKITTTKGTYRPKVWDASHPPEPMFRSAGYYRPGECAAGWVPYASAKGRVTMISYDNSVGNRVRWSTPPASANTALGTTRSFPRFRVTVHQTKISADRYWAGARVSVCVRSAAGYPKGVPVTHAPWTLSTNRGVFTTMIMQEGAPAFGKAFPWSAKLKTDQCATGWVAFALAGHGEGLTVKQVNYRNTFGNAASWH